MVLPRRAAYGCINSRALAIQARSENGAVTSCSLPASILEKSRISSISASKDFADWLIARVYDCCSSLRLVSCNRLAIPRMPFIGVRISWLIAARKRDFARLAASAWSRASRSSASRLSASVTSRPTYCVSLLSSAGATRCCSHSIQRAPATVFRLSIFRVRPARSTCVVGDWRTGGQNAWPRTSSSATPKALQNAALAKTTRSSQSRRKINSDWLSSSSRKRACVSVNCQRASFRYSRRALAARDGIR